jgi:hypothetical protein
LVGESLQRAGTARGCFRVFTISFEGHKDARNIQESGWRRATRGRSRFFPWLGDESREPLDGVLRKCLEPAADLQGQGIISTCSGQALKELASHVGLESRQRGEGCPADGQGFNCVEQKIQNGV